MDILLCICAKKHRSRPYIGQVNRELKWGTFQGFYVINTWFEPVCQKILIFFNPTKSYIPLLSRNPNFSPMNNSFEICKCWGWMAHSHGKAQSNLGKHQLCEMVTILFIASVKWRLNDLNPDISEVCSSGRLALAASQWEYHCYIFKIWVHLAACF